MAKISLSLSFEEEKLDALELYVRKGGMSVQKCMEEALQKLYEETVPAPVREFVDAKAGTKPRRSSSSGSSQARARTPSVPQKEAGAHGQSGDQPATE